MEIIKADPELLKSTSAELEAMLEAFDPANPDAPLEVPPSEPPPEAPVEAEAVEPPPVETPEEPPPDEEIDLAASEKEGDRIAREQLEAKLALLEAHNSRLAGKLGFVEQKLKSMPSASEPYQPETQEDVDRLTALETRLAASEAKRTHVEVSQAIESELNSLDGTWMADLQAEVAAIAPKYVDQINAARESGDPALARQMAKAVGLLVKAEATQMRWDTQHKALVERKASTVSASMQAKKAAAPSGSGSVSPPPVKPKAITDMTAAEADAWLRENVR